MRNVIEKHAPFMAEVEPGTDLVGKKYVRISIGNALGPVSCSPDPPGCAKGFWSTSGVDLPGQPVRRLFGIETQRADYSIQYDLHDNGVVSTYGPPRFKQRTDFWPIGFPFLWHNLLTDSKQDAFSGTLHQFILDAQRDGHL